MINIREGRYPDDGQRPSLYCTMSNTADADDTVHNRSGNAAQLAQFAPGHISAVTADQMVTQLSKAYVALIENNLPLKLFPSVMLWGPPGVGKSQGIKKLAGVLSDRCGKTVVVNIIKEGHPWLSLDQLGVSLFDHFQPYFEG